MRGVENQSCQGFWKNENVGQTKLLWLLYCFGAARAKVWRCPCQVGAEFGAGRANRRKTRLSETVGAARAKLALPVPKLALPVPTVGAASTLLALHVPTLTCFGACRATLLALPGLWARLEKRHRFGSMGPNLGP